MAKKKTKFTCQECGYQSPKYMGKCPGCGQWNTLVEEMEPVVSSRRLNYANAIQTEVTKPRRLTEVETKSEARIETKFQEFNRVLGGGIVDILSTYWWRPRLENQRYYYKYHRN